MKWFFALNSLSASFFDYGRMIKAAVYSAYQNAPDLEPVFLYDGEDNGLTVWMDNHGIPVVRHRVSIFSDLEDLNRRTNSNHFVAIGSGAFLRVDLPEIMQYQGWDDEYILYTDADVLFLKQPDFSSIPCRFFAVAPELNNEDNININTGVMLMNIPNLREHQPEFLQFTSNHLKQLCDLDWDQTAYRAFYHLEWQSLPPEMNWKPYWDSNPDAGIIHFHGLKPTLENEARAGKLTGRLKEILDRAGETYYEQTALWNQYAQGAETPFQFTRSGNDVAPVDTHRYPRDISAYQDQIRARAILGSDFLSVVENQTIPDPSWRVVKGELILWLFSQEDQSEAYQVTSRFFTVVQDYEAALMHARIAYQGAPESIPAIVWLARVLFLQGDSIKARRVLEIGSNLAPDDVFIAINLGYVHLELQEYPAAFAHFRRAQDIDPDNLEARQGVETALRFLSPRPD